MGESTKLDQEIEQPLEQIDSAKEHEQEWSEDRIESWLSEQSMEADKKLRDFVVSSGKDVATIEAATLTSTDTKTHQRLLQIYKRAEQAVQDFKHRMEQMCEQKEEKKAVDVLLTQLETLVKTDPVEALRQFVNAKDLILRVESTYTAKEKATYRKQKRRREDIWEALWSYQAYLPTKIEALKEKKDINELETVLRFLQALVPQMFLINIRLHRDLFNRVITFRKSFLNTSKQSRLRNEPIILNRVTSTIFSCSANQIR